MNIGQLNKKITIQQKVKVADSGGGYSKTWQDIATTWANIKPIKSETVVRAEKKQVDQTHIVTIRYRTDIQAYMRVSYKGRYFYILSTLNTDEQNKQLEMYCVEGEIDD
jgi:SPP1 family predicted phage head-tail adaptor